MPKPTLKSTTRRSMFSALGGLLGASAAVTATSPVSEPIPTPLPAPKLAPPTAKIQTLSLEGYHTLTFVSGPYASPGVDPEWRIASAVEGPWINVNEVGFPRIAHWTVIISRTGGVEDSFTGGANDVAEARREILKVVSREFYKIKEGR